MCNGFFFTISIFNPHIFSYNFIHFGFHFLSFPTHPSLPPLPLPPISSLYSVSFRSNRKMINIIIFRFDPSYSWVDISSSIVNVHCTISSMCSG